MNFLLPEFGANKTVFLFLLIVRSFFFIYWIMDGTDSISLYKIKEKRL